MSVPQLRIRKKTEHSVREDGLFVLYWMTSQRRLDSNYALDRAIEHAAELKRPLVILEALRCDYRWASSRLHRFVIQGMRDNLAAAERAPQLLYYPYVEDRRGAGKGLLESLADEACVVVGDDFPCFFLPHIQDAAAKRIRVAFELVDGNGIYPMHATERVFTTAHSFRRHLQKELAPWLRLAPRTQAIEALPSVSRKHFDAAKKTVARLQRRWPSAATDELLAPAGLDALPIDDTPDEAAVEGGRVAGEAALERFLLRRVQRYAEERNNVEDPIASGLSPWLHFGHVGAHEIFERLIADESWSPEVLPAKASGSRDGWWGMSPGAEAFLDELITWREVGFNFASHRADYDAFSALPDWAQKTLREHAGDERPIVYTLEELEAAETHDEIWNAAQRELLREGRMHNYLRMLWGKKVLEWSERPEDAAEILIELNNRYALDGRNPNSYSGIYWVFGRYDRAWGPERQIFGKVRYMSSDSTRRKLKLRDYLLRYA